MSLFTNTEVAVDLICQVSCVKVGFKHVLKPGCDSQLLKENSLSR